VSSREDCDIAVVTRELEIIRGRWIAASPFEFGNPVEDGGVMLLQVSHLRTESGTLHLQAVTFSFKPHGAE